VSGVIHVIIEKGHSLMNVVFFSGDPSFVFLLCILLSCSLANKVMMMMMMMLMTEYDEN